MWKCNKEKVQNDIYVTQIYYAKANTQTQELLTFDIMFHSNYGLLQQFVLDIAVNQHFVWGMTNPSLANNTKTSQLFGSLVHDFPQGSVRRPLLAFP